VASEHITLDKQEVALAIGDFLVRSGKILPGEYNLDISPIAEGLFMVDISSPVSQVFPPQNGAYGCGDCR
jgi:hypothetical protein